MSTAQSESTSHTEPSDGRPLVGAREERDGVEIHRGYLETFDGIKLYYVRWSSDDAESSARPAIVIMHGYGEHIERYHEVASAFVAAGYPVAGIDARGHGRSDGPRAFVERYEDYVHDLRMLFGHVTARYPNRDCVLVGHSNGGLISIRFAELHPGEAKWLVLTGPLLAVKVAVPLWKKAGSRVLTHLAPRLGMPNEIEPEDVSRDPEIVEAYANDPLVNRVATPRWFTEMQAAAERAMTHADEIRVPVLCLQGGADKLVSPEATQRFVAELGSDDVTFEMLPEHYHEIFNEPDRKAQYEKVLEWLDERTRDARN